MLTSFNISEHEYTQFSTLLEESCGIVLGDDRRYLIVNRLRHLMEDNDIFHFHKLIRQIQLDPKLLMKVIDAMTTNETLWFRDSYPYQIFRERILPKVAELDRPIKIWSAACSTGQEPYSLAIEINNYRLKHPGTLKKVEIIASDISNRVLSSARAGIYNSSALARGVTQQNKHDHFDELGNDQWKISSTVSEPIRFRQINLTEDFSHVGHCDVVFCRNVLFYFASETRYDILERIHALLGGGGYLILGAADISFSVDKYFSKTACHPGMLYQAKDLAASR